MPNPDDYGQNIQLWQLTDAPSIPEAIRLLAEVIPRSVMRFASASIRNATLTAPAEGMVAWLQDTNLLTVYTGSDWLPLLGTSVSDQQSSSFDTTVTSYGTGSSGGSYATCAVVFVAPLSGKVKITVGARMENSSSTAGSLIAPQTRTGSSVGSGAIVEDAIDINGNSHYGSTFARATASHLLSGLTPGATYNTRVLHRTSQSGTTATIALRELIVEPAA